MWTQRRRLLCVDDEPNVLQGLRRNLRRHFDVHTAAGPMEALSLLDQQKEHFPVIVSDMRMPHMDGLAFLREAQKRHPLSVGLLLTGHADVNVAIAAINEGRVFRFLKKPCPTDTLAKVVREAMHQHDLQAAEKDVIERTLMGSIQVMTEILSMVNPVAFGRTTRIRDCARALAQRLDPEHLWHHELAAMLSQLGCVTLPAGLLDMAYDGRSLDVQQRHAFAAHPKVASKLLSNIPRLESVTAIVAAQLPGAPVSPQSQDNVAHIGGHILKAAVAFDIHLHQGLDPGSAVATMRKAQPPHHPEVLSALESIWSCQASLARRSVRVIELNTDMILEEDVKSSGGMLLLARHQRLTTLMIDRLMRFTRSKGVTEPIRVRMINDSNPRVRSGGAQ